MIVIQRDGGQRVLNNLYRISLSRRRMTFWLLPLSHQQVISLSQSSCVSPISQVSKWSLFLRLPVCRRTSLLTGKVEGGGGGGAKS
jgi:hypothetical protein